MKDNKKLERFLFEHGTLISDLCSDYYYDGEEKGRSEGEKRGYEKGYADGYSKGMDENWAFKCGLNDGWRCARAIIQIEYDKAHDVWDATQILNKYTVFEARQIINDYEEPQNELTCDDCEQDCDDRDGLCVEFKRNKNEDYEERQTKKSCLNCAKHGMCDDFSICHSDDSEWYSKWTSKQTDDEIKVGDEVKVYDDCIGIVTRHAPQARTCYVMYRDGSCGEEELTDCKKTGNQSMSLDKWLEQMRKESHETDT